MSELVKLLILRNCLNMLATVLTSHSHSEPRPIEYQTSSVPHPPQDTWSSFSCIRGHGTQKPVRLCFQSHCESSWWTVLLLMGAGRQGQGRVAFLHQDLEGITLHCPWDLKDCTKMKSSFILWMMNQEDSTKRLGRSKRILVFVTLNLLPLCVFVKWGLLV